MNSRLRCLVALATAVAGVGFARGADEPPKRAGPSVVIVGAGQFTDRAVAPRPTADADAKALYDLLTDPRYLGVRADRATLLLSAPDEKRRARPASRDAIIKAVEAAVAQTGPDDLLVLAFFGRGATVGGRTVLLTPGAAPRERANAGLVLGADLAAPFKNIRAQKVLVLADIGNRNSAPVDELAELALGDVRSLLFGPEELGEDVRPPDRLLLFNRFVSPEPLSRGGNGLFAAALLDALRGAADKAPTHDGYESDGVVTADEVLRYLAREMPEQARRIGKTTAEKEARAIPVGGRTSQFVVTRNPDESERVRKRLAALTALAKAGTVGNEVANEGAALLARMPRTKAAQELRKHYQVLADGTLKADAFAAARKELMDGRKLDLADAERYARAVTRALDHVAARYVREVDPGALTAAAIRGLYRRIGEPLPTDLSDALKKPGELSKARRWDLLRDARLRLGRREDLDRNRDAEVSIQMMLANLGDPFTVYHDRETVQRVTGTEPDSFAGVGIRIRCDPGRGAVLVVTPLRGGPAVDAGVRAGDRITAIRREEAGVAKVYPTRGMQGEEAASLIRGKAGTPVTLVIDREGKEITFPLRRGLVPVETVLGVRRGADAGWDFLLDAKYGLGYARLTQFTRGTADDLRAALAELKKSGLSGLVLDLRGNRGGAYTEATAVCEMFVGKKDLVTTRSREGSDARPRTYRGDKDGDGSFKLVVLIDGRSASASEVVAACLRDHGRAAIVGERSLGKASVQDVVDFRETGGEIRVTSALCYSPFGRNLDRFATKGLPGEEWGVRPDKGLEVTLSGEERDALERSLRDADVIWPAGKQVRAVGEDGDRQLKAALEHLRKAVAADKK